MKERQLDLVGKVKLTKENYVRRLIEKIRGQR